MIRAIAIWLLLGLASAAHATTWPTAYPYKQKIAGQKVVIRATPFAPFDGDPMPGETKVFYRNQLLYTIDTYYREQLYTNDDGRYLAIVHSTNALGVRSYSYSFPFREKQDFGQAAITLFKYGKFFGIITLREVLDTSNISHDGSPHDWSYYFNAESFREARFGCESCRKVYGRKVLKKCDTSKIFEDECQECRRQCDSTDLAKAERKLAEHKAFVQDNKLVVLTFQHTVIKLDFSTLKIEKIPFSTFIPDKRKFFPPSIKQRFHRLNYPQFLLPLLANGSTLEQGIARLLHLKAAKDHNDSVTVSIFIHTLLINSEGKCERLYCSSDKRDSSQRDAHDEFIKDEQMNKKVEQWILAQTFDTRLLPKHFRKYKFLDFIYLKS